MQVETTPLNGLVEGLDKIIADVSAAGLGETAALMKIARLDLVLRTNNVNETELQAFLDTVETKLWQQSRSAKPRNLPTAKVTANVRKSSRNGRKPSRSQVQRPA